MHTIGIISDIHDWHSDQIELNLKKKNYKVIEILKMIKEVGVPMTETAGVKMYYEIAKIAYQEGFMAGLKK